MQFPSEDEIQAQLIEAEIANEEGGRFPDTTYEDGVIAALEWIAGLARPPMSD